MQLKSKVLVGVSALGLAAGGGGAAFATAGRSAAASPPEQQAFIQDVAKRLGVTEAVLTDALKGAAGDQVGAAGGPRRRAEGGGGAHQGAAPGRGPVPLFRRRPG